MTDDSLQTDETIEPETTVDAVERSPQYGVGPFTIREVALLGVWLIAFVVSFFPIYWEDSPSVWTFGLAWILTIGVPTAAVGLLVLRRFSPDGIRRVGSLGIDQFASVAFAVAAVVWLQYVWTAVTAAIRYGVGLDGWVPWVELVLSLAGVALTVFAPLFPVLREDFEDRREIPAHRNARPVRAVSPRPVRERTPRPPREPRRPREEKPAPADENPPTGDAAFAMLTGDPRDTAPFAPIEVEPAAVEPVAEPAVIDPEPNAAEPARGATSRATSESARSTGSRVDPEPIVAPTAQQAFWALVPVERDIVDAGGVPLFRIGPTAWALVIEDRGSVFVVRHEDGRTGFLTDTTGVMRG